MHDLPTSFPAPSGVTSSTFWSASAARSVCIVVLISAVFPPSSAPCLPPSLPPSLPVSLAAELCSERCVLEITCLGSGAELMRCEGKGLYCTHALVKRYKYISSK